MLTGKLKGFTYFGKAKDQKVWFLFVHFGGYHGGGSAGSITILNVVIGLT
jgi:hypothetical protein